LVVFEIWKVPISEDYPESLKYSYYLVSEKTKQILVGYDNHPPKGHHRHWQGREEPYEFESMEKLETDFYQAVDEILRQGGL